MQAQKEAGSVEQSIIDMYFLANRMSTSFPGVGRPICGSEAARLPAYAGRSSTTASSLMHPATHELMITCHLRLFSRPH